MMSEAARRWREAVDQRVERCGGDRTRAFKLAYRECRHLAEQAKREGEQARKY